MDTSRILVSDSLAEEGLVLLRASANVSSEPKITADELLSKIATYQGLIVRSRTKVTADVIKAAQNLKVIGRAGVGVDNIDVAAAVAHGIVVVNSPLAASIAVAEHTMGLMLSLARKIAAADAALKHNLWDKSAFKGVELYGKTLGLLGLGRIGALVAERAAAFGMSVLAYDPFLDEAQIRERRAQPSSFDEVLERSDFISLHLPLTSDTRGLIGSEQFAKMKKGTRLICAARGGVIDEEALLSALDSGRVAAAALDVFASEPPASGGIATHSQIVATPHIGAQSVEAQVRAGVSVAEEVLAALAGKKLRWQVLSNA